MNVPHLPPLFYKIGVLATPTILAIAAVLLIVCVMTVIQLWTTKPHEKYPNRSCL
jgi:hypothetical protein